MRVGGEVMVTISSFVFPGPICSSLVNSCRPISFSVSRSKKTWSQSICVIAAVWVFLILVL